MTNRNRRRGAASGGGFGPPPPPPHPASSDLTPAFEMCCRAVTYGVPILWGDEHVEQGERERYIQYGEFRSLKDRGQGGFEEEKKDDGGDGGGMVPVLNFLDEDDDDDRQPPPTAAAAPLSDDPWLAEAYALDRSVREMSDLLLRKELPYSDLAAPLRLAGLFPPIRGLGGDDNDGGMTDAERSELQSSAAAFAAGAANRIEVLRRSLPSSEGSVHGMGEDVVAHRAGVMACLLARLRSDVADRMGRMDRVRNRAALEAARRPFAVRTPLPQGPGDGDDGAFIGELEGPVVRLPPMPFELVGIDSGGEREEKERDAFLAVYADDDDDLRARLVPPKFAAPPPQKKARINDGGGGGALSATAGQKLAAPRPTKGPSLAGKLHAPASSGRFKPQRISGMPAKAIPVAPAANPDADPTLVARYGETAEERESYVEDLQRESAYLTAKLHSELDDVRKVEKRMTEITTLLTQFADLVSEQQQDVIAVKEKTGKSRKNVEAGQEQLIRAAERGKKSKHWMATFIVVLALIMLFLNYITP